MASASRGRRRSDGIRTPRARPIDRDAEPDRFGARLRTSALLLACAEHHISGRRQRVPPCCPRDARGRPGIPGSAWIPPERVELTRLAPGLRLALLATVGEGHGAGPCCETETNLATGAEKCVHSGQNGRGLEEFLAARQRRGEARHVTGLCSLANSGAVRDLLRAFATAAFGGELVLRECGSREGAAHTAPSLPSWRAQSPATGRRAHRARRRIAREAPRVRPGHRAGEAPPLRTLLAAVRRVAARPRPFAV